MTAANMTLNEYQAGARTTAIYPRVCVEDGVVYCALGLNGEAGELAEHAKKMIRDDAFVCTRVRRLAMKKELGDALWYVALLADECGWTLGDIAQTNLDKLADRKERDALHGAGDER